MTFTISGHSPTEETTEFCCFCKKQVDTSCYNEADMVDCNNIIEINVVTSDGFKHDLKKDNE